MKFSYEKDGAYSLGLDCAWIDNVVFPYGFGFTGLDQPSMKDRTLLISPNPSDHSLLQVKGPVGDLSVELTDLSGRIVKPPLQCHHTGGVGYFSLAAEDLAAGMYLVVVREGDQQQRRNQTYAGCGGCLIRIRHPCL